MLFLISCNSDKPGKLTQDTFKTPKPEVKTPKSDSLKSTTKSETKVFKGLYIFGNEVNSFRDCADPTKVYWVEDESKKLQDAYKKSTGYLSYPYESVYVEVGGYLKGKSNIGYAEEYKNVLLVSDVIQVKQKSINVGCNGTEFTCLGNEPFWSLDIIPAEKIIALKDVGQEKTFAFPYKSPKVQGKVWSYEILNERKDNLEIVITQEACSDGMSDRKYNYSALVKINGRELKGCALRGK